MAKIEDRGIRRFYYIGTIIYFIVSISLLAIPIYNSIINELNSKLTQLEESILSEKKAYIRSIVKEKISDITIEYNHIKKHNSGESPQEIDRLFRESIKDNIHNTFLPNSGYIWINEIIDYKGGDNYATRFVHPNLKDTEGDYLSTNFKDIQGNRPYLDELNGINEKGYIFNQYYFKKMDSEEISRKLSYSELFKPYNWIVSTGVYLDDLDELISFEKEVMRISTKQTLFRMGYTVVMILIFFGLIIFFFERRLEGMINKYVTQIESSNISLSREKEKLEKAYRKIENIAYKDYLTGLINRRAMYGFMNQEASRMERVGDKFALLMCDVDYFKKINDTYGHEVGDMVLKEISKTLLEHIRDADRVSRWGGEEFLCMLLSVSEESAVKVAEKLRVAVESLKLSYNGNSIDVTLTIGLTMHNPNLALDKIIDRADEKLYIGKEAGRNRVIH